MVYWNRPTPQKTMYLFYQGRGNNQTGVARFVGDNSFYTTTGEVSHSKRSILAIPHSDIWLYPEISEINTKPRWGGWTGRNELKKRGISVKAGSLNYKPAYPINEPGSVGWYTLRSNQISMGQETDLKSHKKRYDSLMNKQLGHQPPDNVVLFGPSRGAVTSFMALAKHREDYKNVKLCVLEAPLLTYTSVAKYFLGWLGKLLYKWGLLRFLFGSKHQSSSKEQPKNYVDKFPDDVPLVVVSSKLDKVIPHKSSLNLALAVAASRIKKIKALGEDTSAQERIMPVYFIQLDKSGHSLSLGNEKDKLRYQRCLHAIYKKHQLPYVKAFADACEDDITQFELTRGPLQSQVLLHDTFKKTHTEERGKIQRKALCELRSMHALKDKNDDRVLEIAKYMAPYRKSTRRFGFFGQPKLQYEIDQLQSSVLNTP